MKALTPYIVIAALSVVCFLSIRGCIRQKSENKNFRLNYEALRDSAKLLKDENGILHARNTNLQLSKKQAHTFFDLQIDSMADLLEIKPKQIKSIVYVPFRANVNLDSLRNALKETDTLTVHATDTVTRRVYLNGLMSLTKYEKGTGFLNLKKNQYLDVHFGNPIFQPLNVTGFDITEKPKRFGVGPYIGYGWNGTRWTPSIGISIQYNLIRF